MNKPIDRRLAVTAKQTGDQSFCSDPGRSFTMPARFYMDPGIYEMEKEAIFYNSWQYAGHISQLEDTGQYITTRIHEQNIFIIRDSSGDLKAFYNVCQHRGHELLTGQGKTNLIVCPYHAWAYDLDGSLQKARNSQNVTNFNKCDYTLKQVQVEEFCTMVFINLDLEAASLKEQTGGLEDEIREYCPKVDTLTLAQRDTYTAACNWKVLADNFLECYHCDPAHRDFVDLVDMDSYRTTTHGIYSSQIALSPKSMDSSAFKFEKGDVDLGYTGWFVWPNFAISVYPGEPNLSVIQINPDGPENAVEYLDWFLPSSTPSRQHQDAMTYLKEVLQPEDIALCESVQRGLRSKGYNQGRFMVDRQLTELSEHAVHHFQKMVVESIGADLDD